MAKFGTIPATARSVAETLLNSEMGRCRPGEEAAAYDDGEAMIQVLVDAAYEKAAQVAGNSSGNNSAAANIRALIGKAHA